VRSCARTIDTDHCSQLAVEIARKYNGEIINGDAMQLYQGLPIITNKITEDEKKGIPHHLLGCIGLEQETWTVGKFVSNALAVVCTIILNV
jgi:tRNA dimethylallyltransferase